MRVVSDLTFSVAAPNGATATGTVRSEDTHLVVHTTDPRTLAEGMLGETTLPGGLWRILGNGLNEAGLDLTVTGPGGTLATVGAGVRSPVGRLLLGTWRVRLGRPAALVPLVRYQVVKTARHQWGERPEFGPLFRRAARYMIHMAKRRRHDLAS